MAGYIVRRALSVLPIVLIVSMLTFAGQQMLPGDPLFAILGPNAGEVSRDTEAIEAIRHEYGLDQPIPVQYAKWMWKVSRGDFGNSLQTRRPVLDEVKDRIPVTLTLGLTTFVLNTLIALALGTLAALKRGSILDLLATGWAVLGVALPGFWLSILLIIVFAVKLNWLPAAGWVSPFEDPFTGLKHMTLPVISLGLFGSATVMRQTRSALVEVLRQDYMTTARAKGLDAWGVVVRHGLRNAMLPVVTILGFSLANVISGSVLVERVFAIPGLGRLALDATLNRDYPVVQAVVLMSALAVIFANLLADIIYGYLDPRIRVRR